MLSFASINSQICVRVCVLQDEEELVLPLRPQKSPLNGLCCLTFGLVVFMAGLVLASIYVYRYYFIPHVRLSNSSLCLLIALAFEQSLMFYADPRGEPVPLQGALRGLRVRSAAWAPGAGGERRHLPG